MAAPETFASLDMMTSAMTITIARDSYAQWGEEAGPGQDLHVLIGVDTIEEAENVVRALNMNRCPATVTDHEDWSAEDHNIEVAYTWEAWMRNNDGSRNR